ILRNVEVVAESGPKLQVTSPFAAPYTDRLVFSTIDDAGREPGQQARETIPVTVRNIGSSTITLDGASTTGLFSVSGFTESTLAPGQSATVTVNFTADASDLEADQVNAILEGTLTVTDNADALADVSVPLVGILQRHTEDGLPVGVSPPVQAEPSFNEVLAAFGYQIDVGTADQLDNNGIVEAVGDEVLSPFWQATGADQPVEVMQIVAYHQVPTEDSFGWYDAATGGSSNIVFRNEGLWAQSVMPAINDGSGPAVGSFEPGETVFGIRVSGEDSDPAENFQDSEDQGHHMRFFPLRDAQGNHIEDTWLMTMDFIGFNFDYK